MIKWNHEDWKCRHRLSPLTNNPHLQSTSKGGKESKVKDNANLPVNPFEERGEVDNVVSWLTILPAPSMSLSESLAFDTIETGFSETL